MPTQLLSVSLKPGCADEDGFPFSLPAIRTLGTLDLSAPVTLLVGENGTGKSTLLEALAVASQVSTYGSADAFDDETLADQRRLAGGLRLAWRTRSRKGFYLRAEDFFGFLRRVARDHVRIRREQRELAMPEVPPWRADDWRSGVHVDEVAAAPVLRELDSRSHGESFIELFQQRVQGTGLYLLDEPEAPLSPQRQLAFLSLVMDAVRAGAQFVIATHSPIVLAIPGARIYSFDVTPVREVRYDELDHVTLTRDFLANPDAYLRRLADPE